MLSNMNCLFLKNNMAPPIYIRYIIFLIVILNLSLLCNRGKFIKPFLEEIKAFIADNPDLLLDTSNINEKYEVGMNIKTIRFLLGEPYIVDTIEQPWATQVKWIYKKRRKKLIFYFEDTTIVGFEQF